MSSFSVNVVRLEITPHENADALDLAKVGDYLCVVKRGQYRTGDIACYIPEQSVLPDKLIEEMSLTGKLAGPDKNRVKAIRLRGVLSQGLIYPAQPSWNVGDDVTELLGVTKWEPTVPAAMAGEVYMAGGHRTIAYDIENFKKHPDLFLDGEEVVFTEKLHGTWTMFGFMPSALTIDNGDESLPHLIVSSKGLASKGLAIKLNEANKNNLYVRMARECGIAEKMALPAQPVFILGETFGPGVQDLAYSAPGSKINFRVFDVFMGNPTGPQPGRFLDDAALDQFCEETGLTRVPVLYRGPFSKEKMLEYTDGKETISGKGLHIREGIIIRPRAEREAINLPGNRLQLKSVSGDYLTRKGNATEYQ